MKNSRIIIFFIGLILIFNFTIGVATVRAEDDDEEDDALEDTERTIAEKDTYVSMGDPTTNYGGGNHLTVGRWISAPNEAYLYFEFEDEPDNWKEVEISLDFSLISETMIVGIYLIEADWDELTLTWINKPNKSILIKSLTVAEDDIYKFEVTDDVEDLLDDDKEGISICISVNITQQGHFYVTSDEGYYKEDDAPLLIWTYDVVYDVDYITIIIVIIIIAGVVCLVIVLVVGDRKKKELIPKEPTSAIPMTEYQVIEPKRLEEPINELVGKFCSSCGVKLTNKMKFCSTCGANLNE